MPLYTLPIIQELKAVKNRREIASIMSAQQLSEKVLINVQKKLKVGVTEISLAKYIVSQFKKLGVKALAFEPIVAFGKGTADIHHEPSKAELKKGDITMFDFGCTVNGYCSDMTRTYFFGEPTVKFARVYEAVLAAQIKALNLLERGEKKAAKVDAVARQFLHRKYGPSKFTHGLGHGIGTVIHEWPNFKPTSSDVLPVGCVMTVEPGVYLPGWGGIRIEDMVIIKSRGIKNLTRAPKAFKSVIIKP